MKKYQLAMIKLIEAGAKHQGIKVLVKVKDKAEEVEEVKNGQNN